MLNPHRYVLSVRKAEFGGQMLYESKIRELPEEDYSGRTTLRLPKTLHRRLAEKGTEEAVSLNQYMLSVLAQSSGIPASMHSSQK